MPAGLVPHHGMILSVLAEDAMGIGVQLL